MTKRRRILYADKIIQNVVHTFSLLMFLQLKDYYTEANNPLLLYSTLADIRVIEITETQPKSVTFNTIAKGLEQGSAVDFHHQKDLICWSDQTAEVIQCMKYNNTYSGEKFRLVHEGLITPTGIAIDWYTDKLYWTDGETNRIEVISIEQKHRKVLFWSDVDLARAIAVVPKEGLMFWTDWGEIPKVERAGMNGDPKTRRVIVKDDIFWPNGITIDYSKNLIYWVDAKLQFVDMIDFNGQNRQRIVKGGLEYPYALAFFNDKLYWTDWKTWSIHSWDMITNDGIKELMKSTPVPVDIKVYHENRQITPDDFPCKNKNGGCSHLCLLSPTPPGYICACPTGVKLRENSNTTCHSSPQSLLLVAQRSMISKISLDSPDFTPYTLPLKDLKRALTVDFDPKTEYFYWADSLAKTISRARLDGSEQSVVIHSSGLPDSIAIDPLARNIYWTDPVTDTISVAKLDGSCRKVLIHDDLYEPRAIVLHPTAGLMFWSDWSDKRPKIERANLDGSERTMLVSENLTWPNGMALDPVANKLYWGDARTHKIEVCNIDGSGRKELHTNDILHIFGLTLLGNHLYWTDMQRRTLDRINKDTGAEREPVVEQMPNMMGVKAFRLGEPLGWNRCVDDNGGCSHLCFNRPNDYVCRCPLGLELRSDRKTCVEPEAFLVYSRKTEIGRISIENDNNDAVLPIKELKGVSALAVHVSGSMIYWSDSKTKTINRCSLTGTNMETVVEWTGTVEGLAIDWSSQNIYWTDSVTQRIEVARLDGSSRRAIVWQGLKKPKSIVLDPRKGVICNGLIESEHLLDSVTQRIEVARLDGSRCRAIVQESPSLRIVWQGLKKPKSIVLDPRKGYMYWSELGSKNIKRAAMDGSSPMIFMEQVGRVQSLAIDYDKRALYWASLDPNVIEFVYLNGTGRKMLVDNLTVPYALSLFNDRVYWGDWKTGNIEVAKKTDGLNRKVIHTKLDFLSDLKVFHRSKSSGGNQCGVENGGCSHLCLPVPVEGRADYRCACPAHYRLNKDNLTCSDPEEFLLFAQKNAIGRLHVANGECLDAYIPLTGLKSVKAIEYDPVNKHLFWMEDDSHAIRRVPISYSTTSAITDSVSVVSGLTKPFHMVLDVLGRALYWTCADTDSINATSIDGNSSGTILSGSNMMPRHLAFHQTKRLLIWNDVGMDAIMRSSVDGTSPMELARAKNATALTIDQATGTVYWAVNRQIHAVDLDSHNKRVVWQGGFAWALAAFAGHVFLSSERALMRLPLGRRDAPAAPVPHVPKVAATVAVHKVALEHPCYGGQACGGGPGACGANGVCGCSTNCAPQPRQGHGQTRTCPNGHFLCRLARDSVAVPDYLTPQSLHTPCIPLDWKCDGQPDCADGSDEEPHMCGACAAGGGVHCSDGACAPTLGGCDTGAPCLPHALPDAFRCDDRLCLAAPLLCDGVPHCEDGSDEAPAACGFAQKVDTDVVSTRQSNAFVVCGSIVGCAGGVAGAWAALRRWRRPNARRPQPRHTLAIPLTKPRPDIVDDRASSGTLATDSLCSRYERYPRPTANPPPSPATASGDGSIAARRRPYRHYRASNRPPPPTPASTDACESEPEPGAPPPSPVPSPAPDPLLPF